MNKSFTVNTVGKNASTEKCDTLEEAFELYLGKTPTDKEYHELWVVVDGSVECNIALKLDSNEDWE